MAERDLTPFFRPRSVAVVGASFYALRLLRAAVRGERDFPTAVGFVAVYVCWLMVGIKESTLIFRSPLVALGIMCLLYTCTLNRPQPRAGALPARPQGQHH